MERAFVGNSLATNVASYIKRSAIIRIVLEIQAKELGKKASTLVINNRIPPTFAYAKFMSRLFSCDANQTLPTINTAPKLGQISGWTALSPGGLLTLQYYIQSTGTDEDDSIFEYNLDEQKVLYGFSKDKASESIISIIGKEVTAHALASMDSDGVAVLDTLSKVFVWWQHRLANPATLCSTMKFAKTD